jgi:D-glycero-D-manno-heptose 1,7-bisphosphate phosphatase
MAYLYPPGKMPEFIIFPFPCQTGLQDEHPERRSVMNSGPQEQDKSGHVFHFQSGSPWQKANSALLLDRDKTLNEDPGYLNDPDRVVLLPGVLEGLARLQSAGYALIILTNQSGINRGLITPEQLQAVNGRILDLLSEARIRVERVYYCPHVDQDQCRCRKPESGLVEAALRDFRLEASHCWLIGDRYRDLQCGAGLGIPGILVGSENNPGSPPRNLQHRAPDLNAVADFLLNPERRQTAPGDPSDSDGR